ncbi:MAG: hypothetical protein ACPK85_05050 [Methanosarcina sp.]
MYICFGDFMKSSRLLKIFLSTIIIFSLCTGITAASENANEIKTGENFNQGTITLFSQNYSELNNFPQNVFIGKLQSNKLYDKIYLEIYGESDSQVFFNNTSEELKYTVKRTPPIIPCSLLPEVDNLSSFGVKEYVDHFKKALEICSFCNCTCIPVIHYLEGPRQAGCLYICNLTPMTNCRYEISMDMNADNPGSFVELDSPGSKLIIHEINQTKILRSYYRDSSGSLKHKKITVGNSSEKSDFKIDFDGYNKTNTIYVKSGEFIVTPFYNNDRQNLPYIDFSNGYIKFTSLIIGEGTFLDVDIYSINQTAERKLITPIGNSRMIPFGLDGPYPRNTTEKGIAYLNNKGYQGTIWFDVNALKLYNNTDLEYLRNLALNNSWDVGIHYSKELNSLSCAEAYSLMAREYQEIYEKIGKKPTSWCCLRNRDNLTHAVYAYEKFGMIWRNGGSGVHAEQDIGNLDDDTWEWWEPASRAGMTHPVFSHQLDPDPAIKYSISLPKFQNWVDNYNSTGVSIGSFYAYEQANRNTYEAFFDRIEHNENFLTFTAHTNGASSLVNVNVNSGINPKVYDTDTGNSLEYKIEPDSSIDFWVENNHTYMVYLNS